MQNLYCNFINGCFLFIYLEINFKPYLAAMKKCIFICLLISAYTICPKNTSAQYKSVFGETSTSWSEVSCWRYVDGGNISDSFHVAGDTMIGNSAYRKVIRTDFKGKNYAENFMREDTATGKVWFRTFSTQNKSEILLMDMSLQVGDSFPLYEYDGSISGYMTADSVYYINGMKNIRFDELSECSDGYKVSQKITFIEGIGSTAGTKYNRGRNNLLCYFKDGFKEFTSAYFSGVCKIFIVGIEDRFNAFNYLKLYPNPTSGSGMISFQNEKNNCVTLDIYDLNGKRIFQNSTKTTYITFDINAFDNGVYIYKLMNEKGEFLSGRILKQ